VARRFSARRVQEEWLVAHIQRIARKTAIERILPMRSDRVFDALHTLRNRYMLCQLASKATRKFHKPNTRIQETMNEVLDRIASSERQTVLSEPEHFVEAQRRAA
jgi:hypothetical protein